jgi:hypothetical protein
MTQEEATFKCQKELSKKGPFFQLEMTQYAEQLAFEKGLEFAIEKACKIISEKVGNYINYYGDNDYSFDKQGFIKKFKEAMEK